MGIRLKRHGAWFALAGMALGGAFANDAAWAQSTTLLPALDVWASRTGPGIVGASTSVITAEDIQRSPGTTIQDLLGREVGIQTNSTAGAKNGAGTTVDMRGFGATASVNTLVLLNGRRLTDIDLSGVDLSTIPRDSIERIEITRGNSGAVLYGDGAVGGVINIVTKTGADKAPTARVEAGFGSYKQREVNASAATSHGPFAVSVSGNAVNSDGYRVNDDVRQRNAIGDLRYTGSEGKVWLNIAGDDQYLGLPGARLVDRNTGIDELATDRQGATTPNAFSEKSGVSVTTGVSHMVAPGVELILDGNLRRKDQKTFTFLFGDASDRRKLETASVTPRANIDGRFFGLPTKITTGVDYYRSALNSKRSQALTDPPYHTYDLTQQAAALYWQQTLSVAPTTDISFGARLQQTKLSASDIYDATAPGGAFSAQATPLDKTETNHALHLGFEHRFSPMLAAFGRIGRSFRTPNVDERIGVSAFPVDFALKTQTSFDVEGGLRGRAGPVEWQSSVYRMNLNNEILFIPFPPLGANTNLDPTRRVGVENAATWHVSEDLRLKGGLTYTRATFREGVYAGNDVPLVSRWTGNVGLSWNVYKKFAVFDAVVNFVGERRMDNDQANFQPQIPAHTTVDVRLGGAFEHLFWSVSVQNLFDVEYFDYAVASSATFNRYNAYPLAGRTYMVKAGMTF